MERGGDTTLDGVGGREGLEEKGWEEMQDRKYGLENRSEEKERRRDVAGGMGMEGKGEDVRGIKYNPLQVYYTAWSLKKFTGFFCHVNDSSNS